MMESIAKISLSPFSFGFLDAETPEQIVDTPVRRAKPGETLYLEGDSATVCYKLVSGVVKEYSSMEDGRRQIADFYHAGDLLGLSESQRHLHTAEAITECYVRRYRRDVFLERITSSPTLSKSFLDILMTQLQRARERLIMLGRMSAAQRTSIFFQRLAAEQGRTDNISIVMSRQDIADHLGLTIETVCRTITDFKKKGLIRLHSARLFSILDMDALEATGHYTNYRH